MKEGTPLRLNAVRQRPDSPPGPEKICDLLVFPETMLKTDAKSVASFFGISSSFKDIAISDSQFQTWIGKGMDEIAGGGDLPISRNHRE